MNQATRTRYFSSNEPSLIDIELDTSENEDSLIIVQKKEADRTASEERQQ